MRGIKFRAKNKRDEWCYGDLMHGNQYGDWIHETKTDVNYKIVPSTVGQFTGLYDCMRSEEYPRGRPIYEGDFVDFTESMYDGDEVIVQGRGYVKYDDNTAAFVIVNDGFIPFIDIGEMRVIGNVHDNAELLNDEPRTLDGKRVKGLDAEKFEEIYNEDEGE